MINPLQKLKIIIYFISSIKLCLCIYAQLHSIYEYVFMHILCANEPHNVWLKSQSAHVGFGSCETALQKRSSYWGLTALLS